LGCSPKREWFGGVEASEKSAPRWKGPGGMRGIEKWPNSGWGVSPNQRGGEIERFRRKGVDRKPGKEPESGAVPEPEGPQNAPEPGRAPKCREGDAGRGVPPNRTPRSAKTPKPVGIGPQPTREEWNVGLPRDRPGREARPDGSARQELNRVADPSQGPRVATPCEWPQPESMRTGLRLAQPGAEMAQPEWDRPRRIGWVPPTDNANWMTMKMMGG